MSNDWYVRMTDGAEWGPMPPAKLKQLALEGKVTPDSCVKNGESGNWIAAKQVKGLQFSTVVRAVPLSVTPPHASTPTAANPPPIPERPPLPSHPTDDGEGADTSDDGLTSVTDPMETPEQFEVGSDLQSGGSTTEQRRATRKCPYCKEAVLAIATKCRHCGEFFRDERPRRIQFGGFGFAQLVLAVFIGVFLASLLAYMIERDIAKSDAAEAAGNVQRALDSLPKR